MSDGNILSGLIADITGRSAAIEEKIERLKAAKSEISREQSESMDEIKQIKEPLLEEMWKGELAAEFDEFRDSAYEEMEKNINDYDDYISKIEWKIGLLQVQLSVLGSASSLANEAGELLEKGEEAAKEAARSIINTVKGMI